MPRWQMPSCSEVCPCGPCGAVSRLRQVEKAQLFLYLSLQGESQEARQQFPEWDASKRWQEIQKEVVLVLLRALYLARGFNHVEWH